MTTYLWALEGTLPPDPSNQETLGIALTHHSQVTSLLLIRQQVGDQARSYLATEGCSGCLLNHCEVGCRTDLLRRTLAATGGTIHLRHVPLGISARPYTQRWLAWPTKTSQPPTIDLVSGMQEARLVLHWQPGLLPRYPPTLCGLLLAGAEDRDGAERLRTAGWQVIHLPTFFPWYREYHGMPPGLLPGGTPRFAPLPLLPTATDEAAVPTRPAAVTTMWTLDDPLGMTVIDLQQDRAPAMTALDHASVAAVGDSDSAGAPLPPAPMPAPSSTPVPPADPVPSQPDMAPILADDPPAIPAPTPPADPVPSQPETAPTQPAPEPTAGDDAGTLPWDETDAATNTGDDPPPDYPDAEVQLETNAPYRLKNGRLATAKHAWRLGDWMVHKVSGGWSLTKAATGQQQQKFATQDAAMDALYAMPLVEAGAPPEHRPPPPPAVSRRHP